MCQMWTKIRYGVRWNPTERLALAARGINLKKVKTIELTMDPLREGNSSIRTFWHSVLSPRAKMTNPAVKVKMDIANDRRPPSILVALEDGKELHFETERMPPADLLITFNRLLGNPELGKSGTRPKPTL